MLATERSGYRVIVASLRVAKRRKELEELAKKLFPVGARVIVRSPSRPDGGWVTDGGVVRGYFADCEHGVVVEMDAGHHVADCWRVTHGWYEITWSGVDLESEVPA